jgi:hypothetical protein
MNALESEETLNDLIALEEIVNGFGNLGSFIGQEIPMKFDYLLEDLQARVLEMVPNNLDVNDNSQRMLVARAMSMVLYEVSTKGKLGDTPTLDMAFGYADLEVRMRQARFKRNMDSVTKDDLVEYFNGSENLSKIAGVYEVLLRMKGTLKDLPKAKFLHYNDRSLIGDQRAIVLANNLGDDQLVAYGNAAVSQTYFRIAGHHARENNHKLALDAYEEAIRYAGRAHKSFKELYRLDKRKTKIPEEDISKWKGVLYHVKAVFSGLQTSQKMIDQVQEDNPHQELLMDADRTIAQLDRAA